MKKDQHKNKFKSNPAKRIAAKIGAAKVLMPMKPSMRRHGKIGGSHEAGRTPKRTDPKRDKRIRKAADKKRDFNRRKFK